MNQADLLEPHVITRQDSAEQTQLALQRCLSTILDKTRNLKHITAIEPQLPWQSLAADVDAFGEAFQNNESANAKGLALEAAIRRVFYKLVNSSTIEEPAFVQVWNLLDITILCAERNQADQVVAFYLIEELLETQTTDGCRLVFDYLESRREKLLQKDFSKTQLVVLRFCNDLLRRLSRAEDAVFCGRVFFFLFQSFPLGDQSSVNLRGEFHADNVTSFEDPDISSDVTDAMQVDEDAAGNLQNQKPDSSSIDRADRTELSKPLPRSCNDTKFYSIFWRMQRHFSSPTNLFDDATFTAFQTSLDQTLAEFANTPVVVQMKSGGDEHRGVKRKSVHDGSHIDATTMNAKYLTSRDLFELELSDLAFQRHILVQALILIDFLLSLTERAKRKITDAKLKATNKVIMYPYVLDEERKSWALKTRAKIAEYLQKGPDGNFYYRMVNTVLSRDKSWARWKIERCPPMFAEAVPCQQTTEAKAAIKQTNVVRKNKMRPAGAVDLTFLSKSNSTGGLRRLKDASRCAVPSLTKLVDDMAKDKLDRDFATEAELAVLDAAADRKSWQIMRELSRRKLGRLDKLESIDSLDVFLKGEEVTSV